MNEKLWLTGVIVFCIVYLLIILYAFRVPTIRAQKRKRVLRTVQLSSFAGHEPYIRIQRGDTRLGREKKYRVSTLTAHSQLRLESLLATKNPRAGIGENYIIITYIF